MGHLRALYSAIAGMEVSFEAEADGAIITPTAYDLHKLFNTIDTTDLPARVLLPVSDMGDGSGLEVMSAGNSLIFGQINWQVVDLMLLAAVGQGRGMVDYLADLVRYASAYTDSIMTTRTMATGTTLQAFQPSPGIYQWPAGTDHYYFGVECSMSYRELINP